MYVSGSASPNQLWFLNGLRHPRSAALETLAGPWRLRRTRSPAFERLATSPIRDGWTSRTHFADACASLGLAGELVHLEDLMLHDAGMDVRTPTHALTRAHAVLRTRRRIAAADPAWAISPSGLAALCHDKERAGSSNDRSHPTNPAGTRTETGEGAFDDDAFAAELLAVGAVLAHSHSVLAGAAPARERDSLLYDLDWDEGERLDAWRRVLDDTRGLPPLLAAALPLNAWGGHRAAPAPALARVLAGRRQLEGAR